MSELDGVAWLRDALGDETRHPLFFSSARFGSCREPGFWRLSPEIEDFRAMAESLLPRQGAAVVVTDTLPGGDRRHFVGLQLAGLLAERGRRVVLVDAEVEQPGFSYSLEDTEHEGWSDLVLYGASPSATVRQAPLVGLRILPSGSVRPAPGTLLDSDGVRRGLSQLKHEFDCVLILRAAQTVRDEWSEILPHCDGAVLLTGEGEPRSAELVDWLEAQGVALWGAAVFGQQALDVALAIEGNLSEDEEEMDAAEPEPAPVPPQAPAPAPKPAPTPTRPPAEEPVDEDASTPAFRYATIGLLVALLAFVGWWAWSQRAPDTTTPPQEGLTPRTTVSLEQTPEEPADLLGRQPEAADEAIADASLEVEDDEVGETDTAAKPDPPVEEAGGVTVSGTPREIARETAAETVLQEAKPTPPAPRESPQQPPVGDSEAEVDSRETPAAAELPAPVTQIPETDDNSLFRAVGPGWALHPWSFPDSNEALSALGPLLRRGMKPTVRGFVLEERGRWYRVLVGRFATRSQAMAARDRLTDIRGIDWVGVVQIP